MEKIEKENKLEELFKIENTKELYAFLHENGYSKSENEFKAEIEKLVEETAIDLEDSELGAVAGGTIKNKLTKLTSAGMASLLTLGASPISSKAHASSGYYFADSQPIAVQKLAKKDSSNAKKVIFAALGIGGAGTVVGLGGLGAYMLYKKHCKDKVNLQEDINNLRKAHAPTEEGIMPLEELNQEITGTQETTDSYVQRSFPGETENGVQGPENSKDDVGSSNSKKTQEELEQPETNNEYSQRELKEEEERRQQEEEKKRKTREKRGNKILQLRFLYNDLLYKVNLLLIKNCNLLLKSRSFSPYAQEKVLCRTNKLKAQDESLKALEEKINRLENDTSENLDEVQNKFDQLNTQHTITEMCIEVLPLLDQFSFEDIVGEANSLLDEMDAFETKINSLNPNEKNSKMTAFKQQVKSLLERYEEEKAACRLRYTELRTKINELKRNIEKLKRRPSNTETETDEIYELENRREELYFGMEPLLFEDAAAKNPSFNLGNLEKNFENLQKQYDEIKEKLDSKMKNQFGEYSVIPKNENIILDITNTISEKLENDLRNLVGVDIKEYQQSNDTGKETTSPSQNDVINSVRTYFNYMCCAINNYVWPKGSDGHNLLNQKIATDDVPSMLNRLIVSCGLAPDRDQKKLEDVKKCINTIRVNYTKLNYSHAISLFDYKIIDLLQDTGIRNSIDLKKLIKCNKFEAISKFLIALKEEKLIHNYQNIKLENGGEEYTLEQLLQTPSLVSGKFIVNINDENGTQMYINIGDSSDTFSLNYPTTKSQRETLEQVYGEIDWSRYNINQNWTKLLCRAINKAKGLNLNIEKTENTHFDYSEQSLYLAHTFIKELWKQNISNSENIINSAGDTCNSIDIILIKTLMDKMNNGSEVDKETTILNIIRMLIPTHNFEDGFNTELLKASENSDFKISKKWLMEQCDNEYSVEYARSLISKLEKLGINLPETSE